MNIAEGVWVGLVSIGGFAQRFMTAHLAKAYNSKSDKE